MEKGFQEKVFQEILTMLQLTNCNLSSIDNTCKKSDKDKCTSMVKSCAEQISDMTCDQINHFVSQMVDKKPNKTYLSKFVNGWNTMVPSDGSRDFIAEDTGKFIGRLNGNLKCFAKALNSKLLSGMTKVNIPSSAMDKGIREGQKTITKKVAALVIVSGVLLMILLGALIQVLVKDNANLRMGLKLGVMILVAVLMVVCVMLLKM